jgi:hypothetical protein
MQTDDLNDLRVLPIHADYLVLLYRGKTVYPGGQIIMHKQKINLLSNPSITATPDDPSKMITHHYLLQQVIIYANIMQWNSITC